MAITVQTYVTISKPQIERVLEANGYATDRNTVEELAQAYVDCKVAEHFDMQPTLEPELLVQLAHDLDLLQAEMDECQRELIKTFQDGEIRGMRP